MHCASYLFSLILQIAVPMLILGMLLTDFIDDWILEQWVPIATGVLYLIYLIHSFHCSKFSSTISNHVRGLDNICQQIETPKREHPHFSWHIQCYHYETRTRTVSETDANGKQTTRTETYEVRVNTHSARNNGVIPSTDRTPLFVPNTTALMTEIETHLSLDFSHSNYLGCYHAWCRSHRRDVHADESRSESLPSQKRSLLAEWVSGARPFWFRKSCYVLSTLLFCSMCYRLRVQRRCGRQEFTYFKKCHSI